MSPTNPIQFVRGIWSGPVVIPQPGNNLFLRVVDEDGRSGLSNTFSVEDPSDADGDGLPDSWEVRYFGSTSAPGGGPNDDPDGDGLTNLEEFLAGTDPRGPSSGLRLLSKLRDGTLILGFDSIAGKSYKLERTDDLSSHVWIPLTDNIVGTGTIVEVVNIPVSATRSFFYRIRLLE
jgi:hypothetical protein